MIELLASALVAAAAIAFVVEPLTRDAPGSNPGDLPSPEHVARAGQLVADVAARLTPRCSFCGAVSDSPAVYCPACGHILLGQREQASSAV